MHPKTILYLLIATYLISVIINSIKTNGNSGHFAVPYLSLIFLFLCYSVLSILLSLKLYNLGTFQWIHVNTGIVKVILMIGTACILYSVYTAMMIRADWSTYQNQSISNPMDFIAFSSYILLPLLMIIPYAFSIYKNDGSFGQSIVFKATWIFNVIIGLLIYMFMHMGSIRAMFSPKLSEGEYAILQTLEKINYQQKIEDYLFYTLTDHDKRISDAAIAKLKADTTWADHFYQKLGDCDNSYSIGIIHQYLSIYTFEYPEKLMEPFKHSLGCLEKYIKEYADNEYTSPNDLNALQIEKVLQAIEKQFVGQEKMFYDKLDDVKETLNAIKREDYQEKTSELISKIENFKSRFQ
ncbi:MAG: hypothetical protein IPM92_12095 [Saprospiraceae bacterium]|nr:hypothetical protein [Saprospiraceae bacterium]